MNLPLQPALRPAPLWWRRWLALGALVALVLLVGLIAPAARHSPRLLLTDARSEDDYLHNLLRHVASAQDRVWVLVYVMHPDAGDGPVTRVVEALAAARHRGVDVRVILDLDREWDSDAIDEKHVVASQRLRSAGVPVWLDDIERRSHAKTILIDQDIVIVGSHNWTTSALRYNRELSVLHRDRALAESVEAVFADVFAASRRQK